MMQAGTLPPVQKNALLAFPALAPVDQESLWPDYLTSLLRLLRPGQLLPHPEEQLEPGAQPSARELKRWANSSLLMETVLSVLVQLFRQAGAPSDIRHSLIYRLESLATPIVVLLLPQTASLFRERWLKMERDKMRACVGAARRCRGSRERQTWACASTAWRTA